jgi:hypothetical protein
MNRRTTMTAIIDTTLASEDTDDDDDVDPTPPLDNGKNVPEDTTMNAGEEIEDAASPKPPASKSVCASMLPTPSTGSPGAFVGLRGLEAINGAMGKIADKMEAPPPPMISGKFNEAHLFATNALSTADAHVFASAGNCSGVLTKTGTWESKFKKMVVSDEAKCSLIKMCEKQIRRMARSQKRYLLGASGQKIYRAQGALGRHCKVAHLGTGGGGGGIADLGAPWGTLPNQQMMVKWPIWGRGGGGGDRRFGRSRSWKEADVLLGNPPRWNAIRSSGAWAIRTKLFDF